VIRLMDSGTCVKSVRSLDLQYTQRDERRKDFLPGGGNSGFLQLVAKRIFPGVGQTRN